MFNILHSKVNLVVLIIKLYTIVILINLGFSKSQRPLSGSEINQETKENNYSGVKKAMLRAVTDIFNYYVFFLFVLFSVFFFCYLVNSLDWGEFDHHHPCRVDNCLEGALILPKILVLK